MVISAAGMAICLLCGGCKGQDMSDAEQNMKNENASEDEAIAETVDSSTVDYHTCPSGTVVDKAIVAEDVTIGENAEVGVGEYAESKYDKKVYQFDLVTIGERSVIPDGVKIGRNTAISGVTTAEDYHGGELESGDYIIKAGGIQ